jgi:uncharacterized protein (TIGR03083 family)
MVIEDVPPDDVGGLLATERDRLLALLATLSDADWQKPSPCPQWSVLGLCCHLLGGDLGLLSRSRDRHHGTPSAPGATEDAFVEWLDNLQAEWVLAARRLSPRLVVDLLAWTGPQVVDTFRSQDASALTARVSWVGPDAVPVWFDQVRELSECWIHRQQLRQALGLPADLRPDLAAPILVALRWAYPFRLERVPAVPGDTVSIGITGSVSALWHVVSSGARWSFRPEPGPRVLARASMTTDEAWRLLTNNLDLRDQAKLQLVGDEDVVDIVRRTRAIIGLPL